MKYTVARVLIIILAVLTITVAPVTSLQTAAETDTAVQPQQSEQTSGQVIGKPDISLEASQTRFSPGVTEEFQVILINRGEIQRAGPSEYEDRVTTGRGAIMRIRDNQTPFEISTGTIPVGNIPTGATRSESILITVPVSVRPGTYEIPVVYEYDYTRIVSYDSSGAEYDDFTAEKKGSITVQVRDQAQFSIVSQDTVGQVGDTSDISVTLENTGSRTATAASVTVGTQSGELSFGAESSSSTAFAAESWQPGEQRTVNYSMSLEEDATQRRYALDLTVDYADTDGIAQSSRTLDFGVHTRQAQTFEIRTVRSSLRVNREGQLTATISNGGPQEVTDPVANLDANNGNVNINSPESPLPDLAPGEEATVNYSIEINSGADVGMQQFSVQMVYDNQDGDRRTSDPLQLRAPIDREVERFSVEPLNKTAVAGQTTELTLRITNSGDEPLRNIEAQAFVDAPLSSSDNQVFIGRLEPGESRDVSIELSVGSEALEKSYPFSIDFQYETPDGDTELSDTYRVPIQTTQSERSDRILYLGLGGVAILIIIMSGIWFVRQ